MSYLTNHNNIVDSFLHFYLIIIVLNTQIIVKYIVGSRYSDELDACLLEVLSLLKLTQKCSFKTFVDSKIKVSFEIVALEVCKLII